MLNKYIYHQLPPFYMFRCLLHHLQGDHCVTCSRIIAFGNVVTKVVL
jgi:hypothetical protein